MKLCETELNSDFFLQTYKTDKNYANSFAKVGIRNTCLVNPVTQDANISSCISIDIFPLDIFPAQKWRACLQQLREKDLCIAAYLKSGYKVWEPISVLGKLRCFFIEKYFAGKSLGDIIEKQIKLEEKYNHSKSKQIGLIFFNMKYTTREDVQDVIMKEFEGFLFPIPRNYDGILTNSYGNYMKMPPVEQRSTHSFEKIDLGDYTIKNSHGAF